MISSLFVKDFKSIDEFNFLLKKLNLFVGPNSSGKTSAIRALLLGVDNISTSQIHHKMTSTFVAPSSFKETKNYTTISKFFQINIDDLKLKFSPADESSVNTNVEITSRSSDVLLDTLKKKFIYLPANRVADYSGSKINPRPDENILGQHGEFIIDFFHQNKDNTNLPEVVRKDRTTKTFAGQVNYWLKKITGYTIDVIFDDSKYVVRYIDRNQRKIHPSNVGTGVSFITGVLIACFAGALNCDSTNGEATDGGYVIIENPEIHLHPSAQADLMDFFSLITKTNTQLFIETHSDHMFNGVRRLLHKKNLLLEEVKVFNFRLESCGSTSIKDILLSQEGGVVDYEPGLFEQFDKDLDSILS